MVRSARPPADARVDSHVIERASHLRSLNSPSRMAVFTTMEVGKPCTANDLAATLPLRAEAVHYHLRVLESIGLVREAGSRATGRRPQTLFERVVRHVVLRPTRETPAYRRERVRGCRQLLARTARDVAAALAPSGGAVPDPSVRPRVTRDDVRLSARDLKTLATKLAALDRFLSKAHDARHPHRVSVTVAVAPIEASRRKT
jgi:predicted transcriptional regulator